MQVSRRRLMLCGLSASLATLYPIVARGDFETGALLGKRNMLTPTEQLLHSTVMIQCEDRRGVRSSGTGFIFYLFNHRNQNVPVLVSNKHVIHAANVGTLIFTSANADGMPDFTNHINFRVTEFEAGWIEHPDSNVDLAIFPLANVFNAVAAQGRKRAIAESW
jgi:hypothetical protein